MRRALNQVLLGIKKKIPEVSKEPEHMHNNLVKGNNSGSLSNVLVEKIGWSARYVKGLYTKVRSKGNKQEEMTVLAQSQNYDVIQITEMWWDKSWLEYGHECVLFRKDRQERKRGGLSPYIMAMVACSEVQYEVESRPVESCLCESNSWEVMMNVCYKLPNQEEEVDEVFFKQPIEASKSQDLVLLWNFTYWDINQKVNTVGCLYTCYGEGRSLAF